MKKPAAGLRRSVPVSEYAQSRPGPPPPRPTRVAPAQCGPRARASNACAACANRAQQGNQAAAGEPRRGRPATVLRQLRGGGQALSSALNIRNRDSQIGGHCIFRNRSADRPLATPPASGTLGQTLLYGQEDSQDDAPIRCPGQAAVEIPASHIHECVGLPPRRSGAPLSGPTRFDPPGDEIRACPEHPLLRGWS
jgi:hypothetical protein